MKDAGISDSAQIQADAAQCAQCGSTSRVGRGLCLNCLLRRGLGSDTEISETLEKVLNEVDVPDADWRIGNYQILEEIGRGGMGVIYRARQRHSHRIVALKRVLTYHADSRDILARFRREAKAVASLDHPNILPIYEVGESEDGLPFFSMKFAAGGSLVEVARTLRDDTRQIVQLMSKVTRAVQCAHAQGILHRDLKPGNILLDGRGEPMVSDFGLAKWLDTNSDLTRTLTIFGTPGYIAPEQAQGPAKNLTAAADIYSIGAVLFDLFTGRPPFLGEHALAVIKQAGEKPAPKLRTLTRSADRDLETICARCLEREPEARYRSAGDLAEDLERWLEGRPIIARPVSPPVRVWRWSRRNPMLASSLAACALLGAIIGASQLQNRLIPEKSIAVLPFETLGDEKQNEYFANGVQDEILNNLAKVADLKVISRTSVMQYRGSPHQNLREIAKALGVAHLVEGTVQRTGDRVRVSAQLIDARRDAQLWGEHYDRELADMFALESELAQKIASKLRARLSPKEKAAIEDRPTSDLTAYEEYLHARQLFDAIAFKGGTNNLLEAAQLLQSAVTRDPDFMLAYCYLGRVHDILYFLGIDHTSARLALADNAVQAALRLRPDAGEPHLALAQHLYAGYRDYEHARRELETAQRVLPNEPLVRVLNGYIDRRQNRWEESIRELQQALDLDPRNVYILQQIYFNYQYLRRFDEMAALLDRIHKITPQDVTNQVQHGLVDLLWKADPQPLRSDVESIVKEDPAAALTISIPWMYLALCDRDSSAVNRVLGIAGATDACRDDAIPFPLAWCEGVAARSRGDNEHARIAFTRARREAEEVLRQQPDYPEELCVLGMIDAALGRKEEAIREGRRAVELLPASKDSMNSPKLSEYLAIIYAWTGEKNLALDELTKVAQIPSGISYGALRLHPNWDPLRGDPRFEKIVASLAPDAKP